MTDRNFDFICLPSQKGNILHYFDSEDSQTPKSFINLSAVTEIKEYYNNCFDLVTPERVWNLQAENSENFQYWISFFRDLHKQGLHQYDGIQ